MKRYLTYATLVLSLLFTVTGHASLLDRLTGGDGPLPVEEAYQLRADEVAPGLYRLTWTIEDNYYLYRDKIKVLTPEGVSLVEMQAAPAKQKDDPLFGDVWVYYHEAVVDVRLMSTTGASGDMTVEYQGCWEGGVCYPPVTTQVAVGPVPSNPAPIANSAANATGPGDQGFSLTDQSQFASALAGSSLLLTLGVFFLAGLALSFTPCVLPMIPILASVIAGQKSKLTTGRSFFLSVVYVLAMSVTYTIAGVFAGLFGENLQAALQTPWVIILFAIIFVLLSGAMFGFYQLQMPQGLQNALNRVSRSQQGGQVTSVALMGVLSALIVGPCVAAPLAGALIYIGQSGDPVMGGAALFVLSLGMGMPLLLVGASAGHLLPKAGGWMEQVKAGFGVVLLLMAVWMLDRIVPIEVTMLLTGAILIVSAIFLKALDGLPEQAGGGARFAKGVGLLLLIYGGALLIGAAAGNRSMIYPLQGMASAGSVGVQSSAVAFTTVTSWESLEPLLQQAKADGQPVMLDFYADWCVSCKELETFTFADNGVKRELERFKLVKVDVTDHDDASKALYKRYSLIGPPALIFYNANGTRLDDKTLIGVPDTDDFVKHLVTI